MAENQQSMGDSWNRRMRLIRFRRKRESFSFWQEFKIIPRWVVWTVFALFLVAQAAAVLINLSGVGGEVFALVPGEGAPEVGGPPRRRPRRR